MRSIKHRLSLSKIENHTQMIESQPNITSMDEDEFK